MTNYRIGSHRTTLDRIKLTWAMSDHVIIISKVFHILTINCVINLPTVSSEYSDFFLWERIVERSEPKIGWSGAEQ